MFVESSTWLHFMDYRAGHGDTQKKIQTKSFDLSLNIKQKCNTFKFFQVLVDDKLKYKNKTTKKYVEERKRRLKRAKMRIITTQHKSFVKIKKINLPHQLHIRLYEKKRIKANRQKKNRQ